MAPGLWDGRTWWAVSKPGKRADLAVVGLASEVSGPISTDTLAEAVMDGAVRLTMVDGEVVYDGRGIPEEVTAGVAAVRAKLGLRDRRRRLGLAISRCRGILPGHFCR